MSFCVDLVSEDSFYENITLGVTKLLESDPRISNVEVERRQPCDRIALSNWEQKHSTVLPEDLRNFYASTDGFLLTWHYKYSADEILPVGSIRVNTLNDLCLTPVLKDLLDFAATRQNEGPKPALNPKSKVFELDNCRNIGKVCLIYTDGSWSVWLVTREGGWGWLADSFTQYFRMALVHLGLPGWQATFADLPLIPWAEQLFLLLAPHLLDKSDSDNNAMAVTRETSLNHIDPNIFKTSVRQHKNARQANQ
ncbi:LOW QUALITY PROTEIN: tubulin polyglutamylase complex subunit 2 [Danaus plexippus]|uniref:LOW QUALITY PROTEIN: tubulin polyglutamylase complex subunit 2 n=1 Tax=Danaus plexippus TaxID=13037 RepID=UPI002AB24ACE|nr:LOW QUALITY PROTEIN: tubulin polyglutamylase complex subunit 2 [Danaus plexippus]